MTVQRHRIRRVATGFRVAGPAAAIDDGDMEAPATALAKKLKLRPGARAAVIGAPPGYVERLGPPTGVTVGRDLTGPLDWVQVFVRTSAELAAILPALTAALDPAALVWLSYPKGSSKIQTDLTRDRGWEPLGDSNLMWITLVSVDETWSAFSVRPYKPGEKRQTFR
jgi:hypothetical protein